MTTQITCPKCKAKINVGLQLEKIFREKYELKLKQDIDKRLASERKRYQQEIKEELREQSLDEINNLKHQLKEKLKKTKDQALESEMKIIELQKRLSDQKKLTDEMKRKQDMIPQKLQGEVLEIAIEQWLKSNYPSDIVLPTSNGVKGADCLLEVKQAGVSCGKIYFECKRVKKFQNSWIDKLKGDLLRAQADIGVLVTEVLPSNMERFGIKDGVIICTFDEFKGVTALLRNQLVLLNSSMSPQINRESKVEKLYLYLTGSEFKMQFEAIVKCYKDMQEQLEREKSYTKKMWVTREKQIDTISISASEVYSSIKGISGNTMPTIQQLELEELEP